MVVTDRPLVMKPFVLFESVAFDRSIKLSQMECPGVSILFPSSSFLDAIQVHDGHREDLRELAKICCANSVNFTTG